MHGEGQCGSHTRLANLDLSRVGAWVESIFSLHRADEHLVVPLSTNAPSLHGAMDTDSDTDTDADRWCRNVETESVFVMLMRVRGADEEGHDLRSQIVCFESDSW